MCGIVGILGSGDVAPAILDSLKRLEYRGYDSAGIATIDAGQLSYRKAAGKLSALTEVLTDSPLQGALGIGHTRWATHGAATDGNAHPHATERLAIVHNGIIENFAELRAELVSSGRKFSSETDTEVVAQLITHYLENENRSPIDAFSTSLARLEGAFALAVIFTGEDDLMMVARSGSPLAIGRGDGEMFVGSDAYALAPFTNKVTYLDEGDWAVINRAGAIIFDRNGDEAARQEIISAASDAMVGKDGYRHFMAKEIHEQPEVVSHTLSRFIDAQSKTVRDFSAEFDFTGIDRLTISACGTAYYAGLISKYWFESIAKLSVEIDVASELQYREVPYPSRGGALFISQSGETADTLAALRDAKAQNQKIGAIVNVPESSIAREADCIFPIAAGPEIGVASTKAFTCQLAALAAIAICAAKQRGVLTDSEENALVEALLSAPRLMAEALTHEKEIEAIASQLSKARDVLYVGRGTNFPLAMEGALKLKEISYIHAEGYAAGELKHGPIALIDEDMPVVVVAPRDQHFEKTIFNMHEVIARGGKPILVSDDEGIAIAGEGLWASIPTPFSHSIISPIVLAVPIQLLSYYAATAKGTDVDQPRNLAKSVTVE